MPHSSLQQVAIIGVGLLGGSIAKSLKRFSAGTRVVGIGRPEDGLADAKRLGLLDEHAADLEAASDADLIVVCTPVDRIVDDVRNATTVAKCGAVITDVGSVKGPIVSALVDETKSGQFVGSHPMAGSEKSGYQNATDNLFAEATCVICPMDDTPSIATAAVRSFWEHLGGRVIQMSHEEHDRAVALVSHLPHVIAAALARVPTDAAMRIAATGFGDTTRVAAGSPELWTAILSSNRGCVLTALDEFESQLAALRAALAAGPGELRDFLAEAASQRMKFDVNNAQPGRTRS